MKNPEKKFLMVLSVLTLVACANGITNQTKSEQSNDESLWRPDAIGGEMPTDPLARRAVSRWAFLISGHAEKAFEYLTPGVRSESTAQKYADSFSARPVRWSKVFYMDQSCQTESSCEVRVEVEYVAPTPAGGGVQGGGTVKFPAVLTEKWVKLDGEWFHLPEELVSKPAQ